MNYSKGKARPKTSKRLTKVLRNLSISKRANVPRVMSHPQSKPKGLIPGFSKKVGGMIGSYFGGSPGGDLGSRFGSWFGNVSGLGDYKVSSNSLGTVGSANNGPPVFGRSGGNLTVAHREFLTDVTGTTSFTLNSYFINPGLVTTFPFLSQLAANYEQYRLKGLVFEFKSTSGTAVGSTNTALGTVIMSTNYDTLDTNFTSKQQMDAYQFTVSSLPSQNCIHPIECKPRLNTLSEQYVRTGSVPSGADQRFYDMGNFQIATVGMQSGTTVVGELWVSYDIELLRPKLQTPLGADLLSSHYTFVPTTNNSGATPVKQSGSNITLVVTNTNITIPFVGRYLLIYNVSAATSASATAAWAVSTNVTAATSSATFPYVWASANNNAGVGTGTADNCLTYIVDVNLPNGIVTFPTFTIVGAAVADLNIVQIPSSAL
jgi:hypothetical protein